MPRIDDSDWLSDFRDHPTEGDRVRADRLGVCASTVYAARKRLGIPACGRAGAPHKDATIPVRLTAREVAALDECYALGNTRPDRARIIATIVRLALIEKVGAKHSAESA